MSILFISHRLDEVRGIADRITVLRGGRHIATLDGRRWSDTSELISLMVDVDLRLFPPRNRDVGDIVLSVRGLRRGGAFEGIDFDVRAGEVLGFAGLVGAGRTEAMRAVFGAEPPDGGTVSKRGEDSRSARRGTPSPPGLPTCPRTARMTASSCRCRGPRTWRWPPWIDTARPDWSHGEECGAPPARSRRACSSAGSSNRRRATASGGNQQKLVIGKWVLSGADVLIFDEPTRGIDIGSKAEVYRLIHELAAGGAAIVLVSSELPELMNVCHRIIVMSTGRIRDELTEAEFSEQRILAAAFAGHMAATGAGETAVTA